MSSLHACPFKANEDIDKNISVTLLSKGSNDKELLGVVALFHPFFNFLAGEQL